jgi:hypothetical protein
VSGNCKELALYFTPSSSTVKTLVFNLIEDKAMFVDANRKKVVDKMMNVRVKNWLNERRKKMQKRWKALGIP